MPEDLHQQRVALAAEPPPGVLTDDLAALRWARTSSLVPAAVKRAVEETVLAVIDEVPGQWHSYGGCALATQLVPARQALVQPAPAQLERRRLGDLLDEPGLCAKCVHMHLEYVGGHQRRTDPYERNLVRALPRWARALQRVRACTRADRLELDQVPFSALRDRLPLSTPTTDAGRARVEMDATFRAAVGELVERLEAERPHWLHLRYAAERPSGRLPLSLGRTVAREVARGADLDRHQGPALDALEELCRAALVDDRRVPVLVRRTRSGVALGSRHLITPLEVCGDVDIHAMPVSWAQYVDAGQRYGTDWLDLPAGWQDDELLRSRLRTAAALWTGHLGEPTGTLAAAWRCAEAVQTRAGR